MTYWLVVDGWSSRARKSLDQWWFGNFPFSLASPDYEKIERF